MHTPHSTLARGFGHVMTVQRKPVAHELGVDARVALESMVELFQNNDSAAGAVMLGIIATFASIVVGTAAAMFERVLQNAVDIKSENDLTV